MNSTTLQGKQPRIPSEKRKECLVLFAKGYGYKKAARISGVNAYTVRDYKRRYSSGDCTWADRGGSASAE